MFEHTPADILGSRPKLSPIARFLLHRFTTGLRGASVELYRINSSGMIVTLSKGFPAPNLKIVFSDDILVQSNFLSPSYLP